MAEELNSGKVMYAFLKVDDPKTTLPKNVLINWQGEGANIVRKGTCANHVRDISNFFSGAHVTLNARNDEEVEPQIIIEKVAKSSGSSYSFNTRTEVIESQKPVGTNYQRVNPVQEINAQERNQFWLREEQEERKRVEEERKRRESERLKLEQELKRREEVESAGRDVIDEQRNETINRLRLAEKEAIVKENDRKMVLENERLEKELIQDKISSDAQMKKERSQEVQQIIGKNTSNVRSIFEQNTSAGQMLSPTKKGDNGIRSPNKIDTSKFEYEPEIVKTTNAIEPEMENVNDSDDQDQFSTIKRSPKSPNEVVNSENIKNSEIHGNKVRSSEKIVLQEEITVAKLPPIVTEQQMVDEILGADMGSDYGLRARALYDYQAGIVLL